MMTPIRSFDQQQGCASFSTKRQRAFSPNIFLLFLSPTPLSAQKKKKKMQHHQQSQPRDPFHYHYSQASSPPKVR